MTAPDRSDSSDASAKTATRAVGIDVSKASLEVVLLAEDPASSVSRSIPNTEDGFDKLREWIGREVEVDWDKIHVCLEASGGYERPVARYLHEQNLTVSVVNPRRTSAYADSQLNRSKTDKVDARLLARFCQREEPIPWEPTPSEQKSLKDMTRGLE